MKHVSISSLSVNLLFMVVSTTVVAEPSTNTPDGPPAGSPSAPPNDGKLPTPVSDNDVQPEVATPGTPAGGIIRQAGVGGLVGYGRAGVLELGGSAGLLVAKNLTSIQFGPSLGWFIADNFEISALGNINYASTSGNSVTTLGLLVEPSYHLPFNRTVFGFLGVGLGVAYVQDAGAGFAMAPRLGMNLLVGRSGILTPSVSFQYTTQDVMASGSGSVIAVSSALRANVGYTVMW